MNLDTRSERLHYVIEEAPWMIFGTSELETYNADGFGTR